MIALVHYPKWLGNSLRPPFPASLKPVIESWKTPVRYCVEFVDDSHGFDYMGTEYLIDSSPTGGMDAEQKKGVA